MRLFKRLAVALALVAIPLTAQAQDVSNATVTSGGQTKSLSSWFLAFPNASDNLWGTGQPGIASNNGFFVYDPSARGQATLRTQRDVASDFRGVEGSTYKALWGLITTNRYSRGYEWGITGEMYNRTDAAAGAQNVAVNGTIFKDSTNGAYQVGASWGMNANCTDKSTQVDPVASCIGIEVDSYTNATGTDNNRQRVGVQVAMGQHTQQYTTPTHFGYGILLGGNQSNAVIDRGISLRGVGSYGIGIDLAAAQINGAAIALRENQRIAFDANDNGLGGFSRSMRYLNGVLVYESQNGIVFQVSDVGDVVANGRVSAAAFSVQGQAGATCNGPPTTNFRVVNGIVTSC